MPARVLAGHVEAMRVGEDLRIPVGSREIEDDQFPCFTVRPATSVSTRATRALSCTGDSSRRISSTAPGQRSGCRQQGELVGMLEQDPDAAAEQIDRGLEARGEHQARDGPQLLVVESGATFAGIDELAHQVVAGERRSRPMWSVSQALNPSRPCSTLWYCAHDNPMSRRAPRVPQTRGFAAGLIGHAEDVADHGDRQLRAVALDDIDGAARFLVELVDQRLRGCLHPSRSAATALVVNTDETVLR